MSNERIQELVSAAMDGQLSPAERDELDRLLGENSGAQRVQSDFRQIDTILRKLPDLDPPARLHGRIMSSIRLPVPARKQPRLAGWGKLAPFAVLRYGVATAAGVLLALTFYESRPGFRETADLAELAGTMAPGRDRSSADVLDSHTFSMEGLDSRVLLESRKGGLLLDIRVDAEQPVEILVDFASAGARLDAIAQNENAPSAVEIGPRGLRVVASGKGHLTALLHRAEDKAIDGVNTIKLEISSDGRLLQRGSLAATW